MSSETEQPTDAPKRKRGRPRTIRPETDFGADAPERKKSAPSNPTGRNQWTAIRRAIAEGDETAAKIEGNWRERYKAEPLIQRLHDAAKGRSGVKMSGSQIKAAEIILDRLEPRLSSVEQTNLDPDSNKTPEQLLAELKPLLLAHPEYLRALGFAPIDAVRDASQLSVEANEHAAEQRSSAAIPLVSDNTSGTG